MLYIIGENTSITSISISDETGKIIVTSNQNNNISIATLEKGVYFLQITNTKGNEVLKFIKE